MFLPFFDPTYLLFALPALLVMLYAQIGVRGAYGKYSHARNIRGLTGAEAARRLLDSASLEAVMVEAMPGELTDHYDARGRVLRLSESVYGSSSVAAMGIAAHEVGHAIQDQIGYTPTHLRAGLLPVVNLASWLGFILFVLGIVVQFSGLTWLGITLFSAAVFFTVVTLPVEYDANSRALKMLQADGMVSAKDLAGARSVLNAAALSYVSALLQSVGQLLYNALLASGMNREDDEHQTEGNVLSG